MDTDLRWKLVERVVATPSFAKSPRLSSFLLYVVKESLQGKDGELNEQLIGERVFGRPIGYDTRDDNIVRAHACRLRQRLEAYFREEGGDEPLQIVIPRGTYVPAFVRVGVAPAVPQPDRTLQDNHLTMSLASSPKIELPRRLPIRWISITGALACLACVLLLIRFAREGWSTILAGRQSPTHLLWSAIFSPNRDTLIVPADSSLIILKSLTGHSVDITDYASGRYLSNVSCEAPCDQRLLGTLVKHRYTSLADLQFAVTLSHVPEALTSRTQIRYARDLQLDDLKQENLILIGSIEADPWLQLFQRQMNFVLHDDRLAGPLAVENRRPAANEQASYRYDSQDPAHRGYALVASLPNLSGTGDTLVVQGFTLAGTEAAAEFVTDKQEFDSLFGPIIRRRHGLPHFEVLLRTMDVNGFGARPSVVTYRVY